MKPAFGIFFLVFLLQFKFTFGQKENNSVLDKRISIEIRNESISTILDTISQQAHVFFSYNASLIEAEKKTDIIILNKTIQETLDILFNSKFVYKTLDEQIIITTPEVEKVKKKKKLSSAR